MGKKSNIKKPKASYLEKEKGHVKMLQKVLKGEKEEVKKAKK
jgi:hypothetical protein